MDCMFKRNVNCIQCMLLFEIFIDNMKCLIIYGIVTPTSLTMTYEGWKHILFVNIKRPIKKIDSKSLGFFLM